MPLKTFLKENYLTLERDICVILFRYHRLFLQSVKLATLKREFEHFWSQLVRGEQHTLQGPKKCSSSSSSGLENGPSTSISTSCCSSSGETDGRSTSSSSNQQPPENRTPGTIEVKPKCTLGGHVACILSLLAINKVRTCAKFDDSAV